MYRIARSLAHAARPAVRQYPSIAVVFPKIHTVRFFGSDAGTGGEGEEVSERCIEVIKKFEKVQGKEVTSVSKFKEDLDLDSLDAVEIVMALEEEFHVEVPDAEADKILTVQDAIKYFSEHPMAK